MLAGDKRQPEGAAVKHATHILAAIAAGAISAIALLGTYAEFHRLPDQP